MNSKINNWLFAGYTFEQEKEFKKVREEIRKTLFEDNEYCEIICRIYCRALAITIGISIWYCL